MQLLWESLVCGMRLALSAKLAVAIAIAAVARAGAADYMISPWQHILSICIIVAETPNC